jgi:hypothetical protein
MIPTCTEIESEPKLKAETPDQSSPRIKISKAIDQRSAMRGRHKTTPDHTILHKTGQRGSHPRRT